MVDAAGLSGRDPLGQGYEGGRDVGGGSGAALLVVHDRQRVTFGAKAQHRLHEVLAVGGKDPGGAQDRVRAASHRHLAFALGLGRTIDPKRSGRVILAPGAGG